MQYRILADILVAIHFGFVLFVALGGLFALRWPRLAWAHVPAAVWGAWIELADWTCPLTPLENTLRRWAGDEGYSGGFIERYVVPVVYPAGLTRNGQIVLACLVVAFNGVLYASLLIRWRRQRGKR